MEDEGRGRARSSSADVDVAVQTERSYTHRFVMVEHDMLRGRVVLYWKIMALSDYLGVLSGD